MPPPSTPTARPFLRQRPSPGIGLLSGRFPCGNRGGPEGGRKAAGLPLLQQPEQRGGDGVRRQRIYRPWTAGYFSVNAQKSPQIEGTFEFFVFFSASC